MKSSNPIEDSQLLVSIAESSDNAIISTDTDGIIRFWNRGAENLLGYTAKEAQGQHITFIIPPELHAEELEFQELILHGQTIPRHETLRRHKNGQIVEVSLAATPIKDKLERVVGTSRICTNITAKKQAESQAHLLASIVKYSGISIISQDTNGFITSWNTGAEQLFGYTADEAIGRHVTFFIPPERHREEEAVQDRILQGESVSDLEIMRMRKDGTLFHGLVTVSPILDSNGKIVGASRIGIDITKRKNLEEKLQLLAAVVEYSDDSIISIDTRGIITSWNLGAEHIFGFTALEAIGQSILFFIPPELHEEEKTILQRVFLGQSVYRHETSRIRKDGTRNYGIVTISPMRDAQGKITGASRIGMDITQRRQTEERLRLVVGALNAAANGVVIADREGKIIWVNAAFEKLTGYTRAEAKGQTPKVLKSGQHTPEFYADMWQTVLRGEIWHGELINKRKDDTLYHEEMTITPLKDDNGNITHFIAIKQDVSERVKAREERERLIEQLKEALNNVQTLRGLLPICAHCKRIREDSGYWTQVEVYVQQHSDASFTHGICPECTKKMLAELESIKVENK